MVQGYPHRATGAPGDDGNVLFMDCGGTDTRVQICQNSPNCRFKIPAVHRI